MGIKIIGLGPGDAGYLSREAWAELKATKILYLRTIHHPVVADLPSHLEIHSFDHLYDNIDDFDDLYQQITSVILDAGKEGRDVTYAVPGHPLVGESSVTTIVSEANDIGVEVKIIPGISFIEPILTALNVDALDGLQVFDAVQIASFLQPPLNTDIPLILGQVYSRFVAAEVKMALVAQYPEEHSVVLIHAAGTEEQHLEQLPLHEFDRSEQISYLTTLFVPPVENPGSLQSFAQTVAYLRSPDGCPWDQEQTRQTLRADFLEETSEALEAIDADSPEEIMEELGDVLYHIVMQAQIASESEEFTLRDIIAGINAKLIRRHPHIWGDYTAENTADVIRNWEQLKRDEKSQSDERFSLLDNIPSALPALARAQSIQSRVKTVGFDWPTIEGVVDKLEEELAELGEAKDEVRVSEEIGDVLFAIVNWARWLQVDAESSLRKANTRFENRFEIMETMARQKGLILSDLNISELDGLWEEAKIFIRSRSASRSAGL